MITIHAFESQLRTRLRAQGYRVVSFELSRREINTYSLGIEFSNIRGNPETEERLKAKRILLEELHKLGALETLRNDRSYMLSDPKSVHWVMYIHFDKKEFDNYLRNHPGMILIRS